MSKIISRLAVALCLLTAPAVVSAENMLGIAPLTIGSTEVEIPVMLTVDGEFTGFQADITVSDEMSFATPGAELETPASETHQLLTRVDGNRLRVVCFSTAQETFAGSGTLLTLKVSVTDSFISGTISITNAIFSTTDNIEVAFPDSTTEVKALYPSGVEEVTADRNDVSIDRTAPYEVYDLNGRPSGNSIDGLTNGVYIVRQGATVIKTAVR